MSGIRSERLYRIIESICCISKTTMTSPVNYTSIIITKEMSDKKIREVNNGSGKFKQ